MSLNDLDLQKKASIKAINCDDILKKKTLFFWNNCWN